MCACVSVCVRARLSLLVCTDPFSEDSPLLHSLFCMSQSVIKPKKLSSTIPGENRMHFATSTALTVLLFSFFFLLAVSVSAVLPWSQVRQHCPGLPLRGLSDGLHRHALRRSGCSLCKAEQTGKRWGEIWKT